MHYFFYSLDNWTPSAGFLDTQTKKMPITVGMIVGTCVVLTLGVVIFIFVSRYVKNIFRHSSTKLLILKIICSNVQKSLDT